MILAKAPDGYNQPDQEDTRFLITQADKQNVKKGDDIYFTRNRLIIASPDGARWALSVDNAGALTAVAL